MEGTCTRMFPRMLLDKPVELQMGEKTLRIDNLANDLSVGGLFVRRADLPLGASVHVRIAGRRLFEADGKICNSATGAGIGIGFTLLSAQNREALDDLIEDLTLRGLPAAA